MEESGERRYGGSEYEPSAPPLDDEAAFGSKHGGSGFFLDEQPEFHEGRVVEDETLGQRILGMLGGVAKGMWRSSHTVLRVELRRAVSYQGPVTRLRPSAGGRSRTLAEQPGAGPLYSGLTTGYGERRDEYEDGSKIGIQGGGARLKLMQVWDFPEEQERHGRFPWRLNFGVGAVVESDTGNLEARVRVRGRHVALRLLPEPVLEVRGKWPILNTHLALDARYRVPLIGLHRFWEDSGARLMLNLFNPLGTGIHLTPGGLEFDEHVLRLGNYSTVRVAASLDFPRQFPIQEGEQPVKVHINRLGLKTRIS